MSEATEAALGVLLRSARSTAVARRMQGDVETELLQSVVDRAYFAGIVLVSAANNTRGASYPSLFSSVISVATGNSFAAPHISTLVALLRSRHQGLTPFEVKAVLAATADTPSTSG